MAPGQGRVKLAAIILAAGRARRFADGDKLLADFCGAPVMRWTTRAVALAGIGDIVVVVGADDAARRAAAADFGVRFAVNPAPDDGQSSSIVHGIAALTPDCDGAMIVPADMPALSTTLIERAIHGFLDRQGECIVHFAVAGALRPPVIWPRALFAELAALRGDGGGKSIVARHAHRTHPIDVSPRDAWRLGDIDTRDDLAALLAQVQ